MKSYVKVLGCVMLLGLFTAGLSSCASQGKLGCPMKISKLPAEKSNKC